MLANDIDDVLAILGGIVAETKQRKDPLGYFPALYRQVTLKVRAGISQALFDDGPRMSSFDAHFANAYFTAYTQYCSGQRPSRAWEFAFDRTRHGRMLILTDLLLAINAHINLDLGVVVGNRFRPSRLPGFHDDFDRINDLLASLIPLARTAIEEFSPRLSELAEVGGPDLAAALEFSVDAARDQAWRSATIVSVTPTELRPLVVATLDGQAKLLGRIVADPPEPVGSVARHVQAAESSDVVAIIEALDSLV